MGKYMSGFCGDMEVTENEAYGKDKMRITGYGLYFKAAYYPKR